MLTVIIPQKFGFVKSPIPLIVGTDVSVESGVKIKLKITSGYGEIEFAVDPNEAGEVLFDLSKPLLRLFDRIIQAPYDDAVQYGYSNESIMSYDLEIAEVNSDGSLVNPDDVLNFTDADCFYAVLGGISYEYFRDANFFDYLLSKTPEIPFLTWYPKIKSVYPDQPEYLKYFVGTDPIEHCHLEVKVYDRDTDELIETFALFTGGGFLACSIQLISVGPKQLEIQGLVNSYNKHAGRYTVQLVMTESNAPVSEKRTYVINTNTPVDIHYILLLNSLGGLDTVALKGASTNASDVERSSVPAFVEINDYSPTAGSRKQLTQNEVYSRKVNSGFITNVEREWFRELWLSSARWELLNNKWLPIELISKKQDYKSNDELTSYIIEYRFAFDNSVYTPKSLNDL